MYQEMDMLISFAIVMISLCICTQIDMLQTRNIYSF